MCVCVYVYMYVNVYMYICRCICMYTSHIKITFQVKKWSLSERSRSWFSMHKQVWKPLTPQNDLWHVLLKGSLDKIIKSQFDKNNWEDFQITAIVTKLLTPNCLYYTSTFVSYLCETLFTLSWRENNIHLSWLS